MSNRPVRLAKEDNDYSFYNLLYMKAEAWFNRHAFFCLIVLCVVLMVVFVALAYAIVGVSAVESGVPYRMGSWI